MYETSKGKVSRTIDVSLFSCFTNSKSGLHEWYACLWMPIRGEMNEKPFGTHRKCWTFWDFLAVGDTIWTYLLDFKVLLLASFCEWMENIHRWVWRKALPANLAEEATGVADALAEQATGVADASAHLKRPSEQTEKRTFELLQTIQTYITLTNYRCVVTLYVLLFAFFKFGF